MLNESNSNNNINEFGSIVKSDEVIKPAHGLISHMKLKKFTEKENSKTQSNEIIVKKLLNNLFIFSKFLNEIFFSKIQKKSNLFEKKTNRIERNSIGGTVNEKAQKNFMKKSSIDFNMIKKAKVEISDKVKKIERKIKPVNRVVSLSMSTTDFSNASKKPDAKKIGSSRILSGVESTRSSIKKNIKNP